jgi:hypothetical protein
MIRSRSEAVNPLKLPIQLLFDDVQSLAGVALFKRFADTDNAVNQLQRQLAFLLTI